MRAPALGVGASYLHEGTGNEVWSGVLVVPLPFGDFGEFDRARQEVAAARVRAEVDVVRGRLERDVRMAFHERLRTDRRGAADEVIDDKGEDARAAL